jgi:sodium pump decarboxylase gamma subunit
MEEYDYMELTTLALKMLDASDWTVVVAGIGIVLCTLIVLILVFYVFGAITSKAEASSKKRAAKKLEKKNANNSTPQSSTVDVKAVVPTPAPVVEQGISGEIVAAISAAVYELEGNGATITSITPARKTRNNPITLRNPWAQAGVIDNTRPF